MILEVISGILLMSGMFFCVVGGIGLIRMPDFYTRVHAASLTDTLGASLVLMALMLQGGLTLVTAKLVIIWIFMFVTGPAASHALAKAAFFRGPEPVLHKEG
jgi:multicomponent Na+:H+ antiporter subunit G